MPKQELITGTWRDLWYKLLRGAVATSVGFGWTMIQSDPKFLVVIPVIQMAGKFIRVKKPGWAWAIPF